MTAIRLIWLDSDGTCAYIVGIGDEIAVVRKAASGSFVCDCTKNSSPEECAHIRIASHLLNEQPHEVLYK